jgi:hypothetical protein
MKQPPRNAWFHFLVLFTGGYVLALVLSCIYVEDVREGLGTLIDQVMAEFIEDETA